MPAYRYLLCDLLTDEVIAQLPLADVTFERRISRRGPLTGSLTVPTPQLVNTAKVVQRNLGRSALWVYRDNEVWWGGIPWTAPVTQGQRGAPKLTLQASTFDSYAHRRLLTADRSYTAVDDGVIVPDLWRAIQADPRGNIGVEALDQPTGVQHDREYAAADVTPVGKMVEDLGDIIDGPEHTIEIYLDGAVRRKRLRVARRLGTAEPRIVFQRASGSGGRLLEWTHNADVTNGGTTFVVRGEGEVLSKWETADDLLTAGWPLLDVTTDQTDVSEGPELDAWAATLKEQNSGAVRTHAFTVSVGDTGWSPNRIGDAVRLKMADAWHNTAEDTDLVVRPVGARVTASEKDQDETVELLFGDD